MKVARKYKLYLIEDWLNKMLFKRSLYRHKKEAKFKCAIMAIPFLKLSHPWLAAQVDKDKDSCTSDLVSSTCRIGLEPWLLHPSAWTPFLLCWIMGWTPPQCYVVFTVLHACGPLQQPPAALALVGPWNREWHIESQQYS